MWSARELLDVCDTSRCADGEFDAVVAFGGPLSYAFERTDEAMGGLLRIVGDDGIVVASVMSWLGGWRHFLPAITDLEEIVGQAAAEMVMRTGDLRHVVQDRGAHICQMFRRSEIQALRFVEHDATACAERGAVNGGTHILFAATR